MLKKTILSVLQCMLPAGVSGMLLCALSLAGMFLLYMGLAVPARAQDAVVRSVSFTADGASERIGIALSGPVSYRAYFLERNQEAHLPYRLFFDLRAARLGPGVDRRIRAQGACIRAVRTAQNDHRTVRVVLELEHRVYADDYRVIRHDSPPSLEIVLNSRRIRARASTPPVIDAEPPAAADEPPVRVAAEPPQQDPARPRTYLIAIDAGHGGRDPGAIGHRGMQEKEISLAVALALQKALESHSAYSTLMTRIDDRFVSLQDRARIANEQRADVFISIHANSHPDPQLEGIETYYLYFSSDADARRVAARENFTTPEQISDLEMILFDLMQSDKINISSLLAGYVHNNLTEVITHRYSTLRNLGVKHAPMRVLIDADMPGILVETGFISNPGEAERLRTAAHQQLLAEAIADGIHDFFNSSKAEAYRSQVSTSW